MAIIRNKKTGEIREVPDTDLGKYGITNGLSPSDLKTKQQEADIQTQAEATRKIQNLNIEAQFKKEHPETIKPSAEEIKKTDSLNAITQFINTLENHYQKGGGASFGEGPIARILGAERATEGKLGLNSETNIFERQKRGFAATLKELTGDTGVLTENDFKRLAGLVPDMGSTPDEAKNLFNDLRSQIAAKFGGKTRETTINPKNPEMNPLLQMILGGSINFAKDIGTAVGYKSGNIDQSLNQMLATQKSYFDLANKETNPERKKLLNQRGIEISQEIKNINDQMKNNFSSDINKGPLERGLDVATEITGAAALPGIGKGVLTTGGKIIHPFKTVGEMRTKAAAQASEEGIKIIGKDLKEAAKTYVTKDPTAKNVLEKILPGIKKEYTPTQAIDQLEVWNKAYTAAGKVGNSAKAGVYDALAKATKLQFVEKIPQITKANKLFGYLYGGQKFANKMIVPAASAAGVYALLRALGVGQSQQ